MTVAAFRSQTYSTGSLPVSNRFEKTRRASNDMACSAAAKALALLASAFSCAPALAQKINSKVVTVENQSMWPTVVGIGVIAAVIIGASYWVVRPRNEPSFLTLQDGGSVPADAVAIENFEMKPTLEEKNNWEKLLSHFELNDLSALESLAAQGVTAKGSTGGHKFIFPSLKIVHKFDETSAKRWRGELCSAGNWRQLEFRLLLSRRSGSSDTLKNVKPLKVIHEAEILQHNERKVAADRVKDKLSREFKSAQQYLDSGHNPRLTELYDNKDFSLKGDRELRNLLLISAQQTGDAGVATTTGLSLFMDDQYLCGRLENTSTPIYGVFNGEANGRECANYLAKEVPAYLGNEFAKIGNLSNGDKTADIFNILKRTFVVLGRRFLEQRREQPGKSKATIVLPIGNALWASCAGDSRAILIQEDSVVALSEDARISSMKVTIGKYGRDVVKRGGKIIKLWSDRFVFPLKKVYKKKVEGPQVTRAVGYDEIAMAVNPRPKIIKYQPEKALKGDNYLLIASHGLWDVISSNQVASVIRTWARKKNCREMARDLAFMALVLGSRDSLSIVLVNLSKKQKVKTQLPSHALKSPSGAAKPASTIAILQGRTTDVRPPRDPLLLQEK